MYPILTSHDIIMKCRSTSLVNKRRSIWSWWCRTFQCFSNITYSLYKSSDDHSDVELLQLNWWRCVQLVHLADERVSICAGSIVPAIPSILVQQHTMHRRARVWFAVCPARVWHRSHSTLFNPHPATTASHVTATRPPALRAVILWQTQTYTNHTSLTFNDSRSQAYCSRVLIGSGVFFASVMYTVGRKNVPLIFVHNFDKCWTIFEIFFNVELSVNLPPYPQCAATLHCEKTSKIAKFWRI